MPVTWIRSMMIVTWTWRAAACARIWRIWSLFPSASAIQVAWRPGSRRSASANTAAMTPAASAATLAVSHLCRAAGPGPGAGAQDVLRGARDRGDDVDRAGLGHSLAGADLALGQPARPVSGRPCPPAAPRGGAVARAASGCPWRRTTAPAPPRAGPAAAGSWQRTREVSRGRPGQLLGLPGAQLAPGPASDLRARLLQGPARRLTRLHLRQPVRVLPGPQPQLRIGRVHVRHPGRPVGDPGHRHRPEDAGQRPVMPRLRPAAADPVRPRDLLPPFLRRRPRVQVILQQPPLDLPAPHRQPFLQRRVIQPGRLRPGQPLLRLRERLPRPREHLTRRVL